MPDGFRRAARGQTRGGRTSARAGARTRGEDRAERDQAAKEVCALCPVRAECLRHALSVQEPYGVWGGLSEEERRERSLRAAG
ncbi:WhiB family transcriptional regulator [Streptomyces sp. NPDC093224]|uniref:WhiB family transcriptional regulator n=1 Tax=Streptomyces sp. NPDC093224 TaxID=3155198 RepID=UPI00341B4FE2